VDPESADLMGWNSKRILSALTLLIASTVIVAIPAVGVILACALLIIPAVAASLCSAHLKGRLVLGAAFGAVMGSLGSSISLYVDSAPTGPMIVLVGIGILALCAFGHRVFSRSLAA
jgi:manganese/iron transport system permease protein